MKVQILSDLHVEFGNRLPPPAQGADVIALAGDIAPYRRDVLKMVGETYSGRRVLYVPGNHEFYGGDIDAVRGAMADDCATLGIELLDRRALTIDGVRFIGATLWTDFALDGRAAVVGAQQMARKAMPDFRVIRRAGLAFSPEESVRRHDADRDFIEQELRGAADSNLTAVVITHHAPTPRSIRPWYEGNTLNPAFASRLDALIAKHEPPLWIHGHMHDSIDEQVGGTRVVANPGGYTASENPRYDPALCVDVASEMVSARADGDALPS